MPWARIKLLINYTGNRTGLEAMRRRVVGQNEVVAADATHRRFMEHLKLRVQAML